MLKGQKKRLPRDPRVRLKPILIKRNIFQKDLVKMCGYKEPTMISKFIIGDNKFVNIDFLARIANVLKVPIQDIYDTTSIVDENNRLKIKILDKILFSEEIRAKLHRHFDLNERNYLVDMLREKSFDNVHRPKKFLINTISDADNFTQLGFKYKINSTTLSDKIDDMKEIEVFALINFIFEFNNRQLVNVIELFRLEDEKDFKF